MPTFYFDCPMTKKIKKRCTVIRNKAKDLHYVEPEDFDVIIAVEPAPKKSGATVLATMEAVSNCWEVAMIDFYRKKELPDYILIVYPKFFVCTPESQVKTLIHEMFHISPTKRGIRQHIGFGDEMVTQIYNRLR